MNERILTEKREALPSAQATFETNLALMQPEHIPGETNEEYENRAKAMAAIVSVLFGDITSLPPARGY